MQALLAFLPYRGQRCCPDVYLTADVWCRSCAQCSLPPVKERSSNAGLIRYVFLLQFTCFMQAPKSWEGYLLSADAESSTQGTGTKAQQLLRKRYVGIQGSNKVIGALEVQQVIGMLALTAKPLIIAFMLPVCLSHCLELASVTA